MANNRTNPSGAVKGVSGWSQSGQLVCGEFLAPGQFGPGATGWILQPPKHVLVMQVNFDDDTAAVRTIQFGITPATALSQNQQQPQPSPTPPNPIVVDKNGNPSLASVTNGSPTVLFPPPSANPVIAGNPQVLPIAGQFLQFSNDTTRVYTVLSSVAPSTVTLTSPFRGTSQLRSGVSVLGTATINPPNAPASTTAQSVDAVAIIQWVVQGNKVTRAVTVGNGTTISAPAEAVSIMVLDNTYSLQSAGGSPSGSGPGYAYIVNIQVTTGVRATISPPLLNWTYPPGAVATETPGGPIYQPFANLPAPGLGSTTVPIPQGFGVNSFSIGAIDSIHPATAPILNVAQFDASGNILTRAFLGPPDPAEFIPLIPNAVSLIIYSPGPDTQDFSIVYGVDG